MVASWTDRLNDYMNDFKNDLRRNKMAKLTLSIVALLASGFISAPAKSAQLDPGAFFKRFELIRNSQGGVQMIALKKGDTQFAIQPVIDDLRRDLEFAQMRQVAMSPNFDIVMNEMQSSPDSHEDWNAEQREIARRSYQELMKLNLNAVFENSKFKEVMAKFELKVKEHLMGHRVMANLQDSKYFYSRAVTHQLANFGFNLARKYLDNIPVLNIATSIINEAVVAIQERRLFHQYMLLFYLERFEPTALQMTKDEVMYAKSSIYESRIAWFMFPESKKAQQTWRFYGSDYFGYYQLQCDNVLDANRKNYSEVGERLNFAFVVVTEKNQKKIVNLMDRRFMLSSKPADAYIFGNPYKIQRQRRLLRLAQVGIQFVPLPSIVRSGFNMFINSMYANQTRTEGALVGYFEAAGIGTHVPVIVGQTINPFLYSDFDLHESNALLAMNLN
jgi:hypothetical protein